MPYRYVQRYFPFTILSSTISIRDNEYVKTYNAIYTSDNDYVNIYNAIYTRDNEYVKA